MIKISRDSVAVLVKALGFKPSKVSSVVMQGECPKHGSENGACLTIWLDTQTFHCFHCKAGGDLIELVQHFTGLDFAGAIHYIVEATGADMSRYTQLTSEQMAAFQEQRLVFAMLTEAADWYHRQLERFPEIRRYLKDHYGFSDQIIDRLKIGFSPADSRELIDYLVDVPRYADHVWEAGLFIPTSDGPKPFFNGRIVFPYWKGGQVVYMAARACELTPHTEYEVHRRKDGTETVIKYKKLLTYSPAKGFRSDISPYIKNSVFLGEDLARKTKILIITEGLPDWISAVDNGLNAVSPVTVSFREQDLPKLIALTKNVEAVYMINDNEVNQAGAKGALKTAMYLARAGRKVFMVELPRAEGVDKVDLNEYLLDHTAEDLQQLMDDAPALMEVLICGLPKDFLKAEAVIRQDIAPMLLKYSKTARIIYTDKIAQQVGIKTPVLNALFKDVAATIAHAEAQAMKVKVDPKIIKSAKELVMSPDLFYRRIEMAGRLGIVGEADNLAMVLSVIDSRLIIPDVGDSECLALKYAGHFGSGKSHLVGTSLKLLPTEAVYELTSASEKSFFHEGPDAFKHRAVILTEGFNLQKGNAEDSSLAYGIRSLISEGKLTYNVTVPDGDGSFHVEHKIVNGPAAFITTTVSSVLESQLDSRLITIRPDQSEEQTRAILIQKALAVSGKEKPLDENELEVWRQAHGMLEPVRVVVPYAPGLAELMASSMGLEINARRLSGRVFSVIKSVACLYQHQRERDAFGAVIATREDYEIALKMANQIMADAAIKPSELMVKAMEFIRGAGRPVRLDELADALGQKKGQVSTGVLKTLTDNGLVQWCGQDGVVPEQEEVMCKMKHGGKGYVKEVPGADLYAVPKLPTPDAIFGGITTASQEVELDSERIFGDLFGDKLDDLQEIEPEVEEMPKASGY